MKKNYLLTISVLSLLFIFASCEKNDNDVNNPKPKNPEELYAKTEYNLDMRDFAMAVNEAINTNKDFRKLIKDEANKQFDGDYDVLLTNIMEMQVTNNNENNGTGTPQKVKSVPITVRELLEEKYDMMRENEKTDDSTEKTSTQLSKLRRKSISSNSSIIDELATQYPDLQVSVPIHIEDLEDENYIPPVTYVTEDVYKKESSTLVAYKGTETILLDANEAPDYAVIVVGINERMPLPEGPIDIINQDPPTPEISGLITEGGIRITWDVASPNDITYYNIFRLSSGQEYPINIATISALSFMVYDDLSVESNTYYTYYVEAYNNTGSSRSEPITFKSPQKPNSVKSFTAILQGQNEIELRWDNDNSQYISSTKLYRRIQKKDYDYVLYKTFTANDSYTFDRDIKGGDRIFYRITHNNNLGESNGRYDIVYMPYRNILEKSPVILDSISYAWFKRPGDDSSDAIEGWFQGKPEFQIKVFTIDSKGVPTQVFDEKIQATALGKFSCNNWKLHDWLPSNLKWYDVLTFKIIESDPDLGSLTIKVKMELQAKADTLGITAGAGLTAEYVSPEIKFGNGGDDMGLPEYYTYYDPINHTIEFQNYGFKMHLK